MDDHPLSFLDHFAEQVVAVSTKLAETENLFTKMGLVAHNDAEMGRIVERGEAYTLSWVMHIGLDEKDLRSSLVYMNVYYNVGVLGVLSLSFDVVDGWSAEFDRDSDQIGQPWPQGLPTLALELSKRYGIPGINDVVRRAFIAEGKKLDEASAMEILVALGKHFTQES